MRYASSEQLWAFIDHLNDGHLPSETHLYDGVMDVLLTALPDALQTQGSPHFEQLVRLQSTLPHTSTLEPMICLALDSQLPPIYPSGLNRPSTSITASLSQKRRQNGKGNRDVDIAQFLESSTWTSHTTRIVVDLLYLQPTVRPQVQVWLQKNAGTASLESLPGILLALVDSASSAEDLVSDGKEYMLTACARVLETVARRGQSQEVRETSACCIRQAALSIPSIRADLVGLALKECRSLKPGRITLGLLDVCNTLRECHGTYADELVIAVLGHSWTWATAAFSEEVVYGESYRMLDVIGEF